MKTIEVFATIILIKQIALVDKENKTVKVVLKSGYVHSFKFEDYEDAGRVYSRLVECLNLK